MAIDYEALASKHGGQKIDYVSAATKYGGKAVSVPAPTLEPSHQSKILDILTKGTQYTQAFATGGIGGVVSKIATQPSNLPETAEITGIFPTVRALARPFVSFERGVKGGTIEEIQKPVELPVIGEVKPYTALTGKEALREAIDLTLLATFAGAGEKTIAKVTEAILSHPAVRALLPKVVGAGKAVEAGLEKIIGMAPKEEKMAQYVAERVSGAAREMAYAKGKLISPTKIISEKFVPDIADFERAKVAQSIGLEGKRNYSKDIVTTKEAIKSESTNLKSTLKESGAIWNRNEIVGKLRAARSSPTLKLSLKGKDEREMYDTAVREFDKILQLKKGGTLDELLDARQQLDDLAVAADKNIWAKKEGGLYHAVKNTRDVLNNYLNETVGSDIVKASLSQQTRMYEILENLSEKGAKGVTKLTPSSFKAFLKRYKYPLVVGAAASLGIGGGIAGYSLRGGNE